MPAITGTVLMNMGKQLLKNMTKKAVKATVKKKKVKGKDVAKKMMGKEEKGGALAIRPKADLVPSPGGAIKPKEAGGDIVKVSGTAARELGLTDFMESLTRVRDSVNGIKSAINDNNKDTVDRIEAQRILNNDLKKKEREKNLEKKKGIKDKMLESVTKPVGNFLNKLVKFVMMTFVGSVINRVLTLLKDPAQLLDPIKRFFNLVIGLVNSVMKGLWNVTGAPMNFIVGGINKGVSSLLDAINKATGLLNIAPIPTPKIPLIPGPPEHDYIPLSKTAQAKNEGVAMAGGGVVPGMSMGQQIMRQTEETGTFGEAGSSISTFQATPEQRKASYAEMGMPSMELWDGSVVPDIGKIGAEKIPAALAQTRQNMVETGASPERIAKLDELIASPDVQPAALQNSLNRIVPGSQEQVYGDMGDSITASARMNGGGLVPAFAGGGIVGRLKNAGANVLGKAKAKLSTLQKPRVDHIHPPADPVSNAGAAQVAQSSEQAASVSSQPAPGIPNFDAATMRSQSKIRTLGVSV